MTRGFQNIPQSQFPLSRKNTPQVRILHDFAPKITPKQALLEDMFGGVRKMTPEHPLTEPKRTFFSQR